MIKWLRLDDAQSYKLQEWLDRLPTLRDIHDGATFEGHPFSAHYYSTGIGDVFYVETRIGDVVYRCHLAYDDEGSLDYD